MTSPFPGVDPYLEDQDYWREFHKAFISWTQDALAERVPDAYEVRLNERLSQIDESEPGPQGMFRAEEATELRIAIRRFPDRRLVTVIELLSPRDKESPGDELYSKERRALWSQRTHLVELDLLIGGKRLPMGNELLRGHYYAISSRAERRPMSDVWVWSIRDPLATIPIPLMAPDPDIPLNLAEVFNTVYQRGRFERSIDYAAPLTLPLKPEDRAWAEEIARGFNPRAAR